MDLYRKEKFTRIPVYEETRDNVIGILNVKDLLLYDRNEEFHVRDFLREAYYTYELKNTSELLMEMRKNSISIAIVLDEYGATAGLVTLEDLLEEIVGDIRDEFDEAEAEEVQKLGEGEYLVEGSCKLEDLNDMIGLGIESEDYDSLGGYIIEQLDRLPDEKDETITDSHVRLVVDTLDKNRIEKVHIYLPEDFYEEKEDDKDED
jgi:CBS domain containing-hemolysin-like protein